MKKHKVFAPVEVVVVIFALWLSASIILPVLGQVRINSKNLLCRMNLRQWGDMFMMYTNDYDGHMPMGWTESPPFDVKGIWPVALRPYYGDANEVRCCPTANKVFRSDDPSPLNGVYVGWGKWGEDLQPVVPDWAEKGDYGSYGINSWCHDPPLELLEMWGGQAVEHNVRYWRTISFQDGTNVPLFGDASWDGSGPDPRTNPPMPLPGRDAGKSNGMTNFTVPRHEGGTTNMLFLDFSVRNVKMKELWQLKWYRLSEPAVHIWPDWMEELD